MEVDTIQEWHFTNTEFETSHPIHMHVNTFEVSQRSTDRLIERRIESVVDLLPRGSGYSRGFRFA